MNYRHIEFCMQPLFSLTSTSTFVIIFTRLLIKYYDRELHVIILQVT